MTELGATRKGDKGAGAYGPDGDYYYKWLPDTATILFARPSRGIGWTQVAPNTKPYAAILGKLNVLPRLSVADENRMFAVEGAKFAQSQRPTVMNYGPDVSTALVPVSASASAVVIPFYKEPWFLPVAIAGLVILIGSTVILLKD